MAKQSNIKAAFWMGCWLACMMLVTWAGRETTKQLDVFQVMEMRSVLGLALLYPLIRAAGGLRAMASRSPFQQVARNIIHYTGQYLCLVALPMIPLAQVIAIEFTAPIWTALLAMAFLGERMTLGKAGAIAFGLVGVLVIVRPGAQSLSLGQLVVLAAAFAFAVNYALTKSLTRSDTVVVIIFWMLVIQSLIGLVPALLVWRNPSLDLMPFIVLIAFGGSYAHYCMARAMLHADITVITPMDFARVPATALLGWIVYSERIDLFTVAGTVLILAGNLLNLFNRKLPERPEPAA